MQNKIPEIEKTLQMIEVLAHKKSTLHLNIGAEVDFMLSEGVFIKGKSR